MADNDPILIDLELDVRQLQSDFAAIARAAGATEDAIQSVLNKLDKIGGKLEDVSGDIDISVNVDASDVNQALAAVNTLDGKTPEIVVNLDDSQVETSIGRVDALDGEAPEIAVTTDDTDLTATQNKVDTLDAEAPNIVVTTDTTDADTDLSRLDRSINALRRLARFQLLIETARAFNDIGGIRGAIEKIPGVGSITDLNQAVRDFEAQTGKSFPEIRNIIASTFDDGLAESREQVAKAAAELTQYGVNAEDLPDALTGAFNAAAVTGKPVEEILKAQDSIVKNLGGNYTDAANLIVSGYQQGADKGNDFLSLLTEFGPQFKALGIDGANALNLIQQASEGGAGKVQRLGDIFKELNKKITEAVGTKSGPAFDALQSLGLFDEAKAVQAGTMTGADFAQAAIDAAATKGKQGDSLLTQIFGEPVAEFGLDLFKGFDFTASDALIPTDAAQQGADVLTDSWGGAVTELGRTLEDQVLNRLRIGGRDFTAILDEAKTKVQELADLLQSGKGLPEALEIVLEAPGLAEDIARFEASIGDFILDLMTIFADIQEQFNIGDRGANLRTRIEAGGKTQFAYDIQVANPEEIQGVIAKAIDRGVSLADISTALTGATGELIAQGDVDRAQAIVQKVNEIPNAFIQASRVAGQGLVNIPFSVDPMATAEQIQKAKDDAIALYEQTTGNDIAYSLGDVQFTPTVDTTAAHAAVDEALTIIDSGMQKLKAPVDIVAKPFQEIINAIQSPGGQNLVINAAANSTFAAGQQRMSGGIDFSDPANTLYPPEYVEGAKDAVTDIASTSTEQLGYVQTSAKDTATQIDTIVVATDSLQNQGGDKLMAFATIANTAGEMAQKSWAQFAATLANVAGALGTTPGTEGSFIDQAYAGAGVDTNPDHHAAGGRYASGDFMMTGENGPEMMIPDSSGVVIDAETTSAIMQLIGMLGTMGGGGSTTINNTTSYGINSNFNTQSQAQAVGAAAALSRQIRGFKQ